MRSDVLRKLVTAALLAAVTIVLTRFLSINLTTTRIGFGFAALAVSGMVLGPLWTCGVAVCADVIGLMLVPSGVFSPLITVSSALTGLLFGFLLQKKGLRYPVTAAAVNCFVISLFVTTAGISMINANPYHVLLISRIPQQALMFPIQAVTMLGLVKPLEALKKRRA